MVWKDEKVNKLLDVDSTLIESNKTKVRSNLNEFCNYNGQLKEKYINYVEGDDMKLHKSFINLTEKIDNFYSKMMKVYKLLEKIIKYLDTKLDKKEKEKEGEYQTYFIKNKESVLARYDSSFFNNRKSKEFKIIEKINSNQEVKSNEEKKTNLIDDSSSKNSKETSSSSIPKFNKNTFYDCEEEKVILIYKRYVKLYKDFFDSKKKKFDISKIPDIYDNIKYDIIHNKSIIGETALELYNSITNLADFVMPLEYGIKIEEKIKIGLKFIKPLLNKIYKDLLWILNINSTFSSEAFIKNEGSRDNLSDNLSSDNDFDSSIKDLKCLESEEQNYFGLDKNKLDKGEIKSAWRHVKTKIYFTSQSHLYSLLNTLIYSMNSFLVDSV